MSPRRRKRRHPSAPRLGAPAGNPSPHGSFLKKSLRLLTGNVSGSPPQEPAWTWLWWILGGAFAVRVAVALAGDFVVHPDEVMQYLEPAHGAVFGNAVVYWEFLFGARSWLVPGIVAAVLAAARVLAGGEAGPDLYIPAVKVFFCALSLFVPLSMYFIGRNRFGERTGRLALLLGAFWYELVGYAHKPMTEFVATTMLLGTMALADRPHHRGVGTIFVIGLVGVLTIAVRMHYAPLVALVLLSCFLGVDRPRRFAIIIAIAAGVFLVGVFEYLTWGGVFTSYRLNLVANLFIDRFREDESSVWFYPGWLLLASGGAIVWAVIGAVSDVGRRGFLLVLLLALLLPHMIQEHQEYRFVFAAVPLWLLLFADALASGIRPDRPGVRFSAHADTAGLALALVVSVLGILNAIPGQHLLHVANSFGTERVDYLRDQDPIFSAYRHLAADDTVTGVLDSRRPYYNAGGYYYLHRKVPFYDTAIGSQIIPPEKVSDYVSHIVAGPRVVTAGLVRLEDESLAVKIDGDEPVPLPAFVADASLGALIFWDDAGQMLAVEGFTLAKDFGETTVWRLEEAVPSRRWKSIRIFPDSEFISDVVAKHGSGNMFNVFLQDRSRAPKNFGIEWEDED